MLQNFDAENEFCFIFDGIRFIYDLFENRPEIKKETFVIAQCS